ncbi:MAG: LytTR family DNA-binding domain-containing protein [Acidobacteria bacterium]|nr:LytTR family DNA-binding domain-containing protein [Acidobacteriota bacterium]
MSVSPQDSPPLRVYLIDDEPVALRRLTRMLNATGRVKIAGSTTDPALALEILRKEKVDAIFLDIQMPGLNGFELLSRLSTYPPVVFTTAYNQYALRAFEVYSIDYLLKPIEAAHLERAITKLERHYSRKKTLAYGTESQEPEWRKVIDELAAIIHGNEAQKYLQRIPSRAGGSIQIIDVASITHFFAEDKLTYAMTINGGKKYVIDESITELERILDPCKFARIHRAVLLNIDYIDQINGWFAGRLMVRLKDENRTEFVVARDRVRMLKDLLGF